jgi:uncharacterized protein (UPF0332 family)
MGLLEKSEENTRVARKCLDLTAYNAGISRAYYAAFQKVEHILENSAFFDYKKFLADNQIQGDHIPHGKMQMAMFQCILKSGKSMNYAAINVYDNLYRKRRKADYMNLMFAEQDLNESLYEMEIILNLIG